MWAFFLLVCSNAVFHDTNAYEMMKVPSIPCSICAQERLRWLGLRRLVSAMGPLTGSENRSGGGGGAAGAYGGGGAAGATGGEGAASTDGEVSVAIFVRWWW